MHGGFSASSKQIVRHFLFCFAENFNKILVMDQNLINQRKFEELKSINLPAGNLAVFGSGPMCVRGLRECQDLDVIVTEKVFNEYLQNLDWELKEHNNSKYLKNKNLEIELWKNWALGDWNIQELIKDSEVINGIPFVKLEYVLKWKKINNLEKDLKDIKIIEDYLKNCRGQN